MTHARFADHLKLESLRVLELMELRNCGLPAASNRKSGRFKGLGWGHRGLPGPVPPPTSASGPKSCRRTGIMISWHLRPGLGISLGAP